MGTGRRPAHQPRRYDGFCLFDAFTVVVWTLGEILCFPLVTAFISNRSTDANRGRYMGMYSFTFSVSIVVSPALGAWIYEMYGPTTLWFSIGSLGVFLFMGFLLVNKLVSSEKKLQIEEA